MIGSKEKKMAKSGEHPLKGIASRAVNPFEEMERRFDDFFAARQHGWLMPFGGRWPSRGELAAPLEGRTFKVDVIDRDNEVVVKAELPGVKKEHLDVTVGDNSITIRATTSYESQEQKENYYRSEIRSGEFMRTVGLPAAVDADKAKAKFSDGVLEMTLPKVEAAKRRHIKID